MIYLWKYECFYTINHLKGEKSYIYRIIDDKVLRFLKAKRVSRRRGQMNVILSRYMVNILREII